jgi:peptidoglycan/LPS O-acetylase OafA/YrhL
LRAARVATSRAISLLEGPAVLNAEKVEKAEKDASIETLRGLACVLLVMAHVIGENALGGLRVPHDSIFRWYVDSFAYLRMPLFTFISGYVYAMRPLTDIVNWPDFIRGKARRLLLPMVIVGTFLALLQTYGPGVNEPLQIPWYLWNIVPISPFWFIWSIFWVFAVVTLIDAVADARKRTALLVTVGVVMASANALLPESHLNVVGWRTTLYLGPFFIAGLLASRFSWRTASVLSRTLVVASLAPLLLVTQLGVLGVIAFIPPRESLIATVTGVVGCLSLLLTRWKWRPLTFIGKYSFTIYLFHVPAAVASRVLLSHAGVHQIAVLAAVCVIVGIAVPIVIETRCRKNRWTSLLILGQRLRPRVAKEG